MKTARRLRRFHRTLRQHRVSRNLRLEPLESRQLLALLVDTFADLVADDGHTSLREAISLADDNGVPDTIVLPHAIDGVEGTYTLTLGELSIDDADALTIESAGGLATIDAQGASRVFSISAGSNVTLDGLVITGGYSAGNGGGIISQGTLTILNSAIQGNRSDQSGGGLENAADATISNTLFQNNYAGGFGGGFRNLGVDGGAGDMVVTDCIFLGNTAVFNGGGLDNNGVLVLSGGQFGPAAGAMGGNYAGGQGSAIGNGGILALSDTAITSNTSYNQGGGIFNAFSDSYLPSELHMTGVTFRGNNSLYGWGGALSNFGTSTTSYSSFFDNTAANGGGAIDNYVGTLVIDHSYFDNNTAGTYGGAIHNYDAASLEVRDSSITNNTSSADGGGIVSWYRPVSISGTTISGNTATFGSGGGLANFSGTVDISGSSIEGNTAYYSGGGILNDGTLDVSASAISTNTASYYGGGIYNAGTLSVNASAISTNTASYYGGGVYNGYYAAANLAESHLESNTAGYSGGGLYSEYSYNLSLDGSTVSANSASYAGGLYVNGYSPTITGNLITGNQNGGLVLYSDYGLVTGNSITQNVGDGIQLEYGNYNTIGTLYPGEGNTITGNAGAGVVVGGYYTSIRGNVINSNGGLAIDLGDDGRTPNDPGDGDYGPNDLQNYPVITSLTTGTTTVVTGRLSSTPNSSFTIDIYAQDGAAPVNPGSSIRYLGSVDVTTDASGNAIFDVLLDAETFAGELVSVTATDVNGNTSEFSDFNLVQVAPFADLFTSEGGAQATFRIVLAVQPTADVTVALTSSNTVEGTVSPAEFTFTPENWADPQVATITGVDDTVADGPISYTIITDPALSADVRFEGFNPDDVQVLNYDNDLAP